MIRLPSSLPPDLRTLFEQELGSAAQISDVLLQCAPVLLRLFNARDALTIWHSPGCRSITRAALPATSDLDLPNNHLRAMTDQWLESSVDHRIRAYLASRLSCASFSAFSWPFGSLRLNAAGGRSLSIPRDYTLLIPLDSHLSIHTEDDVSFVGYIALFFDTFPQLGDLPIQLIVVLPGLLSELLTHMLRSEREMLSEPALTTVHELKRGILFAIDQLDQLRALAPDDLDTIINRILRNLTRMNRTASGLLLSDRIDSGGLQVSPLPICINEIVEEVAAEMTPLFEAAGMTLDLALAPSLPKSPIDPSVFPTVFGNVLENAIKYSHPGGRALVRTKLCGSNRVAVELLDDGIGIDESEWPRVFAKRYRTPATERIPGNGLGLFLAHHIVEAHGGTIELFADDHMPTAFRVRLPIYATDGAIASPNAIESEARQP